MADQKITELTLGTPETTDVIPFVDLNTGTTKKATKADLKGDQGDAATLDVGTTTTGNAGTNASVTNVGSTSAAVFNFTIPRGDKGDQGDEGAKVVSVAFSGDNIVFTLDDSSTVTLTDAKIELKGDKGDEGAKITSGTFVGDDLVFTLDDASTATVIDAKITLKGDQGDTGDTGASITSAAFVSNDIVFTKDDTNTVTLTDAKNELKGDQGDPGPTGPIGITWKGAWSAGTYQENDGVSHNGSSWIATAETTEEPSGSATEWDLVAAKGADGTGVGDMMASTYDPQSIEADAFNVDNHTNGNTNKVFTSTEQTKLTGIETGAQVNTVDSVAGKTGVVTLAKGDVGLENVDNTSDATKNSATATLTNKTIAFGDNTLTNVAGTTATQTLTNKRITKRVTSETSSATPTINTDNTDVHRITAQAVNITSMTTNLSGTPTHGQSLIVEITGTATRTVVWGASFEDSTIELPTTTDGTNMLTVGFKWNSTTSKWRCLAIA